MFIKRIRLLSGMDFIRVSLPILALLSVFFLKKVLISDIQESFQVKLKNAETSQGVNVDRSDSDFLSALLGNTGYDTTIPFQLRDFDRNSFISGFYNNTKPRPVQRQEQYAFSAPYVPAPLYNVSAVFSGQYRKYAVIDGNIVALGGTLPGGDRLKAVRSGSVLISGIWGKQWFYVTY